jgi:site-specific DNA recombinase
MSSTQKKLDNLIAAIEDGMYNPSMKATMDSLEKEKTNILIMIRETKIKMAATALDKNMIIAYLEKDIKLLENKKPDDLKRIIQTYIEKVVIYEEHIDVFLIFIVHTIGGGEPTEPLSLPQLSHYSAPLKVIRFAPIDLVRPINLFH